MRVIMAWSENLSLTQQEKQRHKVFEKSILRLIFGPKKQDVTAR
jgi:hypothetical protein